MTGILLTENANVNPMARSNAKDNGGKYLFQITPATWKGLVASGQVGSLAYQSAAGQIVGACALMQTAINTYGKTGNGLNAAIVSYNMGPVGANAFITSKNAGATDDVAVQAAVTALAASPKGGKGDPQYLNKVHSKMNASLPNTPITDDTVTAQLVPWMPVDNPVVDAASLVSQELVIPEGIDTLAWFDDPQAIVGNPSLLQASPVTFTINLREFDSKHPLPTTNNGTAPLVIRLNCSLSDITVSMKHIINKTNTRTGFHMTFWGMEPDTITGSGSTGVFMNRTGVTDLMSVDGTLDENGILDAVDTAYGTTNPSQFQLLALNSSPLRVAAQDAFLELLATFRNNGVIRYRNENYTSASQVQNRLQLQNSVWSAQYGGSSYTRLARVNDVMVKGNVVMRFKSNLYHGYFKSLNWSMDADHPFQWKFDFTFQVQKTISYVYYPKTSTTDLSNNSTTPVETLNG
jgi:hypothetical protein